MADFGKQLIELVAWFAAEGNDEAIASLRRYHESMNPPTCQWCKESYELVRDGKWQHECPPGKGEEATLRAIVMDLADIPMPSGGDRGECGLCRGDVGDHDDGCPWNRAVKAAAIIIGKQ